MRCSDRLPPWLHLRWHTLRVTAVASFHPAAPQSSSGAPPPPSVSSPWRRADTHGDGGGPRLLDVTFRPATPAQPLQITDHLLRSAPLYHGAPNGGGGGAEGYGGGGGGGAEGYGGGGGGGAEGYGGGVEVGRGHSLGWSVQLPPHAHLAVEIDFVKPVAHLDAQLADASRGLPLGGAFLLFETLQADGSPHPSLQADGSPHPSLQADGSPHPSLQADGSPHGSPHERTHALLPTMYSYHTDATALALPIADASMPFNVRSPPHPTSLGETCHALLTPTSPR